MDPTTLILGALAVICFSLHILLERKGGGSTRERVFAGTFFWIALGLAVAAIALRVSKVAH